MSTREDDKKDRSKAETSETGSHDGRGVEKTANNRAPIVSERGVFDPEDYEQVARRFDLTTEDAKYIATLVASCFDADGRFKRDAFESCIPEFSRFQRKIFELLWDCLKSTLNRHDRIAFLNSMQLLIVQLKQPKKALKALLNDFCTNTDELSDSDRDALMLSNLLVRKYNKELHTDIDTTPEEVLLVKNGLDRDVTKYAQWRIESTGDKFLQKIGTIREMISATVDPHELSAEAFPVNFLLSLERELHIFLSLVEGEVAYRIIRKAVEVYGSPDDRIYQSAGDSRYLPMLIQHLKVLIRGMARVGDSRDLALLEGIKQHAEAFMQFGKDPEFQGLVRQMLQWVDISMDRTAATP